VAYDQPPAFRAARLKGRRQVAGRGHADDGGRGDALDIEFGDAGMLDTAGGGWFLGFGDWTRAIVPGVVDLRHMPKEARSHSLCMKWMAHLAGDPRGAVKPPSEGRSLSLLVSERGRFRIQFSGQPDFSEGDIVEHTLERHGQFVAWGEGIHHRWFADEDCTILTLRWVPEPMGGASGG
jgi:hypothetical protein